jgi:signal transduction histidine kinase
MQTRLARKEDNMDDDVEHGSSLAERSLNLMERHVQDLLDLALIKEGGFTLCREPTPLPAVMLEVLDAVRDLAASKELALERCLAGERSCYRATPSGCSVCWRTS